MYLQQNTLHSSVYNNYMYVTYFQVGLAVDDIKGIQAAASLKKLALQVCLNHLTHVKIQC